MPACATGLPDGPQRCARRLRWAKAQGLVWRLCCVLGIGIGFGVALALPLNAGAALGERPEQAAGPGLVSLSSLPPEARRTESLIRSGGPFAASRDGVVFGNRERLLPRQPRGYYHEYTVPTPGVRDRGARRIVCGGHQPRPAADCFYTDDHYASFRRIVP